MTSEEQREAVFAEPIEVKDVTITPLVEVHGKVEQNEHATHARGSITPLGLLIDGPDGTRAVDLDGQPLPLATGSPTDPEG